MSVRYQLLMMILELYLDTKEKEFADKNDKEMKTNNSHRLQYISSSTKYIRKEQKIVTTTTRIALAARLSATVVLRHTSSTVR